VNLLTHPHFNCFLLVAGAGLSGCLQKTIKGALVSIVTHGHMGEYSCFSLRGLPLHYNSFGREDLGDEMTMYYNPKVSLLLFILMGSPIFVGLPVGLFILKTDTIYTPPDFSSMWLVSMIILTFIITLIGVVYAVCVEDKPLTMEEVSDYPVYGQPRKHIDKTKVNK